MVGHVDVGRVHFKDWVGVVPAHESLVPLFCPSLLLVGRLIVHLHLLTPVHVLALQRPAGEGFVNKHNYGYETYTFSSARR